MDENQIRQVIAFFTYAMTEFIERAKAQGVTTIKVPGFEAAWNIEPAFNHNRASGAPRVGRAKTPSRELPLENVTMARRLEKLALFVMPIFKEWRGRTLSEIPRKNLQSMLEWLESGSPDDLNETSKEVLEVGWEYLRLLERLRL